MGKKDCAKDKCQRCQCPVPITLDSINSNIYYDLTEPQSAFDLFRHRRLVQGVNHVRLDYDHRESLKVEFREFTGSLNPGFLVLFKTDQSSRYQVNIAGKLEKGNSAFVVVQSYNPDGLIVSDTYKFHKDRAEAICFEFTPASNFTSVGVFFFCTSQDYLLRICDFRVRSLAQRTIPCESWIEVQCPKRIQDCCSPCQNPCSPCQNPCVQDSVCKEGGSIRFLSINYRGKAIKCIEPDSCRVGLDEYILETQDCVGCRLWQCIDGNISIVIPTVNPFYFYDTCCNRIYKSRSGKCRIINGCIGDQIWDLTTNQILEYRPQGWKPVANVILTGCTGATGGG